MLLLRRVQSLIPSSRRGRIVGGVALVLTVPAVALITATVTRAGQGAGASSARAPAGSAAPGSPLEANAAAAPMSSIHVDHGELDIRAPDGSPELAATVIATTVYKEPNTDSRRLGYIRLGGKVRRDKEPVKGRGCREDWYRVYPTGFVCLEQATIDLADPVVRATQVRANLSKPLPYRYGFVRATAPQYLRVPTKQEQIDSEFKLEEHLSTFQQSRAEWQKVALGANDVPLDARGIPVPGRKPPAGVKPATEWTEIQVFGGTDGKVPWWLEGGRKIPNVSAYKTPDFAIFADRIRRKTGVSFVDAFHTEQDGLARDFGVAVDMRLIPLSKVKPDSGSAFHGIELRPGFPLPFAFVRKENARTYQLIKNRDQVRELEAVPFRSIVPLSGKARIKAGERYYQTQKDKTLWLRGGDLGLVGEPPQWPEAANQGEKWIDVSISQQTLVLYEGKRPFYATLVSTGRDGMGDPEKTLSTVRGTFRMQSKHIAAAMDSEENSSVSGGTIVRKVNVEPDIAQLIARLKAAKKAGKKLSAEDERRLLNVEKGRHPEYGVTQRRGAAGFELRDVPWIQYFAAGYALHGAYWHDVFGTPRSHGCVNLSPIDARVVFMWTDPPVPEGWHGVNIGDEMGRGTVIVTRE
jgi:lipoprotein-anchoring transpeptidase ErfK/SrfK